VTQPDQTENSKKKKLGNIFKMCVADEPDQNDFIDRKKARTSLHSKERSKPDKIPWSEKLRVQIEKDKHNITCRTTMQDS